MIVFRIKSRGKYKNKKIVFDPGEINFLVVHLEFQFEKGKVLNCDS